MNKRDIYLDKARARIDEQLARLDRLKAQARGSAADRKLQLLDASEKLERQIGEARAQLDELKEAAEGHLDEIGRRVEKLTDDIGASFKRFLDRD